MKNIVGLAVAVEGVEGFMPASHVELRRVEDFSDYIGKELEAEVIEVDTAKKRLVVSRSIFFTSTVTSSSTLAASSAFTLRSQDNSVL